MAALLEREELKLHCGRGRKRPEAAIAVTEQLRKRRVERHLAELEPGLVGVEAGDGSHEIDEPFTRAAALEEPQRTLDLRMLECVPASCDSHERILRLRELDELLLGDRRVAHGEPPVESREHSGGQEPARADRGVAAT